MRSHVLRALLWVCSFTLYFVKASLSHLSAVPSYCSHPSGSRYWTPSSTGWLCLVIFGLSVNLYNHCVFLGASYFAKLYVWDVYLMGVCCDSSFSFRILLCYANRAGSGNSSIERHLGSLYFIGIRNIAARIMPVLWRIYIWVYVYLLGVT